MDDCPICFGLLLMPTVLNSGTTVCINCSTKLINNKCPFTRIAVNDKYTNRFIHQFIYGNFDVEMFYASPNRNQYIKMYDRIEIKNYSQLNKVSYDELKLLIDRIDPLYVDEDGRSLNNIILTSKAIEFNIFKYYIEKYPNALEAVICKNTDMRLIHILACKGYAERLEYIIKKGANISSRQNDGATALHLACANNRIESVRVLLKSNADIECVTNISKCRPIHRAVMTNSSMDIIRELIAKGVDLNTYVRKSNVLMLAAKYSDNPSKVIDLLVSGGADINCKYHSIMLEIINRNLTKDFIYLFDKYLDIERHQIIHTVCVFGTYELFEYLIKKGVNLNARNSYGFLPIHVICIHKSEKWLWLLNENFETPSYMNGDYPLHMICRRGSIEMLKYIIEIHNVNINCVNSEGERPIHIICKCGTVEMLKYIISLGANVNCYDIHGWHPLHYVENVEMMKVLIDEGYVDINTKTKDNNYSTKFIEIRSMYRMQKFM